MSSQGEQDLELRRQENIRALLSDSLETSRQPLLSKYLVIKEGEQILRREFRSPHPGAPARSEALVKRLLARKRFVPWGSSKPFKALTPLGVPIPQQLQPESEPEPEVLPPGIEPLILWEASPPDLASSSSGESAAIEVDPMLTRWLRPHQREGVQFMFDCVTGQRLPEGQGCILADDMGLGKTLQGITLLWTLLQQGAACLGGNPIANRVIICCPTSLVSNWDQECTKWLKGRVRTLALCESSREDVLLGLAQFLAPANPYQVLIISYETFRLHAQQFTKEGACDLLICDEAHRLKNDSTLTNRALDGLPCKRRVLLSGTPMQNHLDEFYAMVDFCNPGVLGTPSEFRRHFESPILAGREPGAPEEDAALGESRSSELSSLVNQFILRRTNKLLSDHLPPKVVEVVVCRLTHLQQQLYCHFLDSKTTRRLLSNTKASGVLGAITSLKKLCNHPKLIYDALHSKTQSDGGTAEGWEGVAELFPPGLFDNGRPGRGGLALGWEYVGSKMAVVARMLELLKATTDDKVVIVSNYTQTLDLFGNLCRARGYGFLRLDGSTSISKRQKLVTQFNDPSSSIFVFLLSSKAGGCGLNLVGGNRLVLFDPDWNPANDKQAAARVWRDGQQKRVYVYRMLSAGTIEEKVFQRQISKEGLQQVVDNASAAAAGGGSGGGGAGGVAAGSNVSLLSQEQLRELFSLLPDTASDTYDLMCGQLSSKAADGNDPEATDGDGADHGGLGPSGHRPQQGNPGEEDLQHFGHHAARAIHTVPDAVLQQVAGEDVTFVFSCQVAGKKPVKGEAQQAVSSAPQASAAPAATASAAALPPQSSLPAPECKQQQAGGAGCRKSAPSALGRPSLNLSGMKRPRSKSMGGTAAAAAAVSAPAAAASAVAEVVAPAAAAAHRMQPRVAGVTKPGGSGKVKQQTRPAVATAAGPSTDEQRSEGVDAGAQKKRPCLGHGRAVGVARDSDLPLGDVSARVSSEDNVSRSGHVECGSAEKAANSALNQQQEQQAAGDEEMNKLHQQQRQQQPRREGGAEQAGCSFGHGGTAAGPSEAGNGGEGVAAAAGSGGGGGGTAAGHISSSGCSDGVSVVDHGSKAATAQGGLSAQDGQAGCQPGGQRTLPRITCPAAAAGGGGEGEKGEGRVQDGIASNTGDGQRPAAGLKRLSVSAVKRQRISIGVPGAQHQK